MALCIGLTMNVAKREDVLSPEWDELLERTLPDASRVPIENVPSAAARLLESSGVGALIFTGGNDVGSCEERDRTERCVLDHALRHRLPVLGVCRGLQLLQVHFGGPLRRASARHDAGRLHEVRSSHPLGAEILGDEAVAIPSYHRQAVFVDELAPCFEAWAVAEDGVVEGLVHREAPILAVQWHPERPLPALSIAKRLLRRFVDA